jgi:hypothetical protein
VAKRNPRAQLDKELAKGRKQLDFTKSELDDLGFMIVEKMKELISRGISPITGKRFPAYKDAKRYPAKQKPARPVNLWLSGDFLDSLVARVKGTRKPTITIGFDSQESNRKESGHREGANGQLERPIIPEGSETFSKGVLVEIQKFLARKFDRKKR